MFEGKAVKAVFLFSLFSSSALFSQGLWGSGGDHPSFKVDEMGVEFRQNRVGAPLALVIPTAGGKSFLEHVSAQRLFVLGYSTAIVDFIGTPGDPNVSLEEFALMYERQMSLMSRALTILMEHGRVSPKGCTVFGASFGAIVGSSFAKLEPRVEFLVAIAGGGPLPEMFLSTANPSIKHFVRARKAAEGLETDQDFITKMRSTFVLDPATHFLVNPGLEVFFIKTLRDAVIHPLFQQNLIDSLPKVRTMTMEQGHFYGIGTVHVFFAPIGSYLKLRNPALRVP